MATRISRRISRHPYTIIDGRTGAAVCVYKSLTIALRDCGTRNAAVQPDRRFYVLRPDGSKITA